MPKGGKSRKDFEKAEKSLEYGNVSLNTINQKMNVHNTIYSWRIPNYRKLKRGVMYFQEFDSADVKCVFKIFKTGTMLYLCLRCGQIAGKRAQFYVISETDAVSISVEANEIGGGLFTGEFEYEMFEGTEVSYITDGMLTVSFRYISDNATVREESEFDGVDVLADLDELCCDLKKMYLESMYPDFEIHSNDYVFKAHKFILAARCTHFQNFFEDNADQKQFTFDAVPGLLHEVLLYVYCGELKEMDLECMKIVTDIASELGIQSLIDKCCSYFVENVVHSNFNDFETFQRETEYTFLDDVMTKLRQKLCIQ